MSLFLFIFPKKIIFVHFFLDIGEKMIIFIKALR